MNFNNSIEVKWKQEK